MYNKLSQIYDFLMIEEVDYNEWTNYIKSIFSRYDVQVNRILDLGCGTGNITIPLSEQGFHMTGVDLSEEMLSVADSKAFEQNLDIQWIYGDMTKLAFPSTYDSIISCCDSVNYVLKEKDLLEMFQNVYKGLNPNGIFTFDIHSYCRISEGYRDEVFTYTSDEISYIWENNYDETTEVIEYYLNIFLKNEENPYYSRAEEIHYQRAYKTEVVKNLLQNAGFQRVDVYKFNTFEATSSQDERLQFCCMP